MGYEDVLAGHKRTREEKIKQDCWWMCPDGIQPPTEEIRLKGELDEAVAKLTPGLRCLFNAIKAYSDLQGCQRKQRRPPRAWSHR